MLSNYDIVKEYTKTINELQDKNDFKEAIIAGLSAVVISSVLFVFFLLDCR